MSGKRFHRETTKFSNPRCNYRQRCAKFIMPFVISTILPCHFRTAPSNVFHSILFKNVRDSKKFKSRSCSPLSQFPFYFNSNLFPHSWKVLRKNFCHRFLSSVTSFIDFCFLPLQNFPPIQKMLSVKILMKIQIKTVPERFLFLLLAPCFSLKRHIQFI